MSEQINTTQQIKMDVQPIKKPCSEAQKRATYKWRETHKDQFILSARASSKKYHQNNRELVNAKNKKRYYENRIKILEEQNKTLLEKQIAEEKNINLKEKNKKIILLSTKLMKNKSKIDEIKEKLNDTEEILKNSNN